MVVIGVNERGHKKLLAIEDGERESTQSWREGLLALKERGINQAELGIGDGALGFWNAQEEVYPATKHQRCWVHKTATY
ncbi:MAG: putative transposase [Saprospiraceae bacterium]